MFSFVCRRCLPAVILMLAAGYGAVAQKPADDPFSDANRFPEKASQAGKAGADPFADPFAPRKSDKIEDRIKFEWKVTPSEVRRGQAFKLELIGLPEPGYYTYPLTQRGPEQPAGQLAVIKYENLPGFQPLFPMEESSPVKEDIPGLGLHLKHKDVFTWGQDILVTNEAKPGKTELKFHVTLQVCDETCITGTLPFSVPVVVTDAAPVELSPALQAAAKIKSQAILIVGNSGAAKSDSTTGSPNAPKAASLPATSREPQADGGLIAFMLQGFLWGGIALFTPCVFPMIPITVSFFLKQSEREGHRPFLMAAVYSLTIVTVLTVSGVALIGLLQQFSQHWITNAVLGLIFFLFALSLFGMFDIVLPASLANLTQSQEGRGGLIGVIFMALTFTIISFTCVAPFYGNFIGLTATAQSGGDWVKVSLGSLSFSLAFASPFFLLALFPTWLRSMPQSGGWMNTVKVVMGFLEVAAAIKFMRASEIGLYAKAELLTYDLCLGLYVALCLLCGFYLLNLYRLPHDEETTEPVGVPRLMISMLFLTLGFYIAPALFKTDSRDSQRPNGAIFAWLDSFLLPDSKEEEPPTAAAAVGGARPTGRLAWIGGLKEGLEAARKEGRYVFVDFTGQL